MKFIVVGICNGSPLRVVIEADSEDQARVKASARMTDIRSVVRKEKYVAKITDKQRRDAEFGELFDGKDKIKQRKHSGKKGLSK